MKIKDVLKKADALFEKKLCTMDVGQKFEAEPASVVRAYVARMGPVAVLLQFKDGTWGDLHTLRYPKSSLSKARINESDAMIQDISRLGLITEQEERALFQWDGRRRERTRRSQDVRNLEESAASLGYKVVKT